MRLLERVHATDEYPVFWPDDPARWLSPQGAIRAWVAERSRDVVGHVLLRTVAARDAEWQEATAGRAAELGVISRLFVDSDLRGAGLGRSLLDAAMNEALSRGLCPVLDVVATRVSAVQFFERQGFRRVLTKSWSANAECPHHFFVGLAREPQ